MPQRAPVPGFDVDLSSSREHSLCQCIEASQRTLNPALWVCSVSAVSLHFSCRTNTPEYNALACLYKTITFKIFGTFFCFKFHQNIFAELK